MKRLFTTVAMAVGFSTIATFTFFQLRAEAQANLEFRSLYHQVQMFIGNEGDYYNKVTYPQSTPEVGFDDFFIEIVHQGQLESPFWMKWGLANQKDLIEPEYFTQKVKYISITSDQPFLDYNPGDDLSEIFLVEKKENLNNNIPTDEPFLKQLRDIRLKDFSSFLFTLSTAPTQSGIYQFTFNYILSDGKKLSATSRQLNIRGER